MKKFAIVEHGLLTRQMNHETVLSEALCDTDPFVVDTFDDFLEARAAFNKLRGVWSTTSSYLNISYYDIVVFALYPLDADGEPDLDDPLAVTEQLYANMHTVQYVNMWMSHSDRDLLEELPADEAQEEIEKSIAFLNGGSRQEYGQVFLPPHGMTAKDFIDCWNYLAG